MAPNVMGKDRFNQGLLQFLQASPTPFHAVMNSSKVLDEAGFVALDEQDAWQLKPGGAYYVTRNASSIIAFRLPETGGLTEHGFRMLGAHTDSPCLKVKPSPELQNQGYFQLGVEVYGGALLNPWFDRDLSLAGRINYLNGQEQLCEGLIDFQRPLAVIPSLAIHLDREANKNRCINPQTDLPPVLSVLGMEAETGQKPVLRELLKAEFQRSCPQADISKVLDYELCFYAVEPPRIIGLKGDFIASARLDNLLSCFVGLHSLLAAISSAGTLLVCSDHEEVGSLSAAGAQGPFLKSVLERITPDVEARSRVLARSQMISVDNAHGVHPNYPDKHDANHGPMLNAGPVIKLNANQRYATSSQSSAHFRHLAAQEGVPVQAFVVRSDQGCGSTIGPITAGEIGVSTLDVGVPTFAMHSIRELAGSDDGYNLYRVLKRFAES